MKKLAAFLLLIIAVAGSFIPCCAVDDCCADQTTSSTNHEKHETEGTCSPFFSCATCPGFVSLSKTIAVVRPAAEKQAHHERPSAFFLPSYSSSFWQPPRIG